MSRVIDTKKGYIRETMKVVSDGYLTEQAKRMTEIARNVEWVGESLLDEMNCEEGIDLDTLDQMLKTIRRATRRLGSVIDMIEGGLDSLETIQRVLEIDYEG